MPETIIWLTGLAGAGKSSIADELAPRMGAMILDPPAIEKMGISEGPPLILDHVQLGAIARDFCTQGICTVIVLDIPSTVIAQHRAKTESVNHRLLEVFVDASFDCLLARRPNRYEVDDRSTWNEIIDARKADADLVVIMNGKKEDDVLNSMSPILEAVAYTPFRKPAY